MSGLSVPDSDQDFDAFLLGTLGQVRQTHDADLICRYVRELTRVHVIEMVMGMGRRVVEFSTWIDVHFLYQRLFTE